MKTNQISTWLKHVSACVFTIFLLSTGAKAQTLEIYNNTCEDFDVTLYAATTGCNTAHLSNPINVPPMSSYIVSFTSTASPVGFPGWGAFGTSIPSPGFQLVAVAVQVVGGTYDGEVCNAANVTLDGGEAVNPSCGWGSSTGDIVHRNTYICSVPCPSPGYTTNQVVFTTPGTPTWQIDIN